jgi:hypothetical protein
MTRRTRKQVQNKSRLQPAIIGLSMKDRAVKERGPSVFNDIWSLLERGYEQVGFKVAGKSYLIVASHEERPLVRAELLAAKNEANRGIVVNEDDEEAFLGYYLDQEGNCCGDNKPQSWRAAPETLARKVVLAARLHSVRLADENRALKMAQANSSRKKRLAKRVTSASGGSDFSPELLRAIFDERKTELITIEIRGKEYLINARYHDHSIVKAELLATTEDEDTGSSFAISTRTFSLATLSTRKAMNIMTNLNHKPYRELQKSWLGRL